MKRIWLVIEGAMAAGHSLLDTISGFCRRQHMVGLTAGGVVPSDGKLVSHSRGGARIWLEALERVNAHIAR